MRNGILLAEDTPINIMERFNCTNLEDAFLTLCQKHGPSEEADRTTHESHTIRSIKSIDTIEDVGSDIKKSIPPLSSQTNEKKEISKSLYEESGKPITKTIKEVLSFTTKRRMNALLSKNFLQMIRQPA